MPAYEFAVNGKRNEIEARADESLLWLLRERMGLTGAKYGCGEGACGACTVLVDGVAKRSCLLRASDVAGRAVTTIEGLERDGKLHPVQEAFVAEEAFQCGFCTPGMVMGAVALLDKTPKPTEGAIRRSLEGHICRCGTYPRIVAAVRLAARGGKR
jgi:aerobic-type carbon monoxide dehydrogenase small subunit (CoxS/CutS family)